MADNLTAGVEREEYLELFLESTDFNEPMRQTQDTPEKGPDPSDHAFPKHHGLFSGFNVFMGNSEEKVWRVVDIRWVFPNARRASEYLVESIAMQSEGAPPVAGAPEAGAQCQVFGGEQDGPLPGLRMTTFHYIFRVLNVVVKLFVAQGPQVIDENLTADDVVEIARRIETRITSRAQ